MNGLINSRSRLITIFKFCIKRCCGNAFSSCNYLEGAGHVSRERILLIEDEERLRNNLHRLLRRDGYDITAAASGDEGLAYAQGKPFHVVVTDLVMETFNHFDLLDRLVAHIPKTPIIVMTGHASILTKAEALSRGASDFLAKPFAIGILRAAIAQALQSHHPRDDRPANMRCQ